MHPNQAFDWNDRDEVLRFVAHRSFAHIFAASDAGLFVVHAPVLVTPEGKIRFHVSRRNRIADQLDSNQVLVSLSDRDGYQSANWYVSEDQVPTWHYQTAEIEGRANRLSESDLVDLLDALSERFENLHSPERPWTRAKMTPGTFDAMTKAVVGFELDPVEIRGTRKFNQHKGADDLAATVEGQRAIGREDIVAAIGEVRRP